MKNFEKHIDEISSILNDLDCQQVLKKLCNLNCSDDYNCVCGNQNNIKTWLLSEAKEPYKLTKAEYYILKSIKNFEWVVRDDTNYLFLYTSKPVKGRYNWRNGSDFTFFTVFDSLFQFVKWEDEEPASIKELLANCEVIDDE